VILYFLNRKFGFSQHIVNKIAALSFGIFFLHGYLLSGTKIIVSRITDFSGQFPGNPFSYLLFSSLVVVVALAAIEVLRRILGKSSRYVIGC
jgi:peptidoglycan/LPS O-acetylase OafA/YrhL